MWSYGISMSFIYFLAVLCLSEDVPFTGQAAAAALAEERAPVAELMAEWGPRIGLHAVPQGQEWCAQRRVVVVTEPEVGTDTQVLTVLEAARHTTARVYTGRVATAVGDCEQSGREHRIEERPGTTSAPRGRQKCGRVL